MSKPEFASALERAKAIAKKLTAGKCTFNFVDFIDDSNANKRKYDEDHAPTQAPHKDAEYQPKSNQPQKTIEVTFANHMTPIVIGRGGETMKGIEKSCNVMMKLDHERLFTLYHFYDIFLIISMSQISHLTIVESKKNGKDEGRTITITGDEKNVKEAKAKVDDILHGRGALQVLYGAGHQPGHQTVYVQVPLDRVGLVIGKGGETIQLLQERSGAKMNVVKDGEDDPRSNYRTVVVSGPQSCIKHAQELIHEIVQGGTFTGQFGVGGNSETIMIGLIIGKGGETIKTIQKACQVKLTIDANGDVDGERPVTISGTLENIAMAKEQRRGRASELNLDYEYTYTNYTDPSQVYAQSQAGYEAQPGYDGQQAGYDASAAYQYDPKLYAEYYAQYYASQGYPGYGADPEAYSQGYDQSSQADSYNDRDKR
ncbi:hypothetical protein HDV02_004447 [Globomyces sp. JEL0801]|nr:hypothetical protein HDV02_004447 [Globomyces sp. JEL0801]